VADPVDLIFSQAPITQNPVDLVFGAGESPDIPLAEATLAGTLPSLVGAIRIAPVVHATVQGVLPGLSAQISAQYISGASRPVVGEVTPPWQVSAPVKVGTQAGMQKPSALPAGSKATWSLAVQASSITEVAHSDGVRDVRPIAASRFQSAVKVSHRTATLHQDGVRDRRIGAKTRFQRGNPAHPQQTQFRHQDTLRDRRNLAAARWQAASAHYVPYSGRIGPARWHNLGWHGEFQQAMKPPAGMYVPPEPPEHSCYTPSGDLLFSALWDGSAHLVFICDDHGGENPPPVATVVVPIKEVYVVLNETTLRRVDGNIFLPTFDMSMSLDTDSWTWTFSASLPGQALGDLEPASPDEPVLVEAMINGVAYRMLVENCGRDRSFNSSAIRISGRGLAASLDEQYSPVMSHANADARTAQQLMNDVLTLNGVPIGWTVDWQAVDWSIPAGVFSHQGAYISALNKIAAAAGSYIQPHRVDKTLHVLPRYPSLPWEWSAITPDIEIPSSVATVESTERIFKPVYNRVYVSGVSAGVLGQVTRAGTDGGLVAPMVVDPLITTEAAARQRGRPVLADTGRQIPLSLRLPVLPETGVIPPGKLVRYVDGGTTYLGLSRAVQLDARSPEVWQTIRLETHV
jgi:hypothetical protein